MVRTARVLFGVPTNERMNAITIAIQLAIADTWVMSVFIIDGVAVDNKRIRTNLITINMPDGRKVQSMHVCNIIIPGLPTMLIGHVVPHLAVASLMVFPPSVKQAVKLCLMMKNVMSYSMQRLFYVATKICPRICGRFCLTPWLGIPIFGSKFWDPHRKQNSDSVFDSKDSDRIFF
jgi:hypothetical protein